MRRIAVILFLFSVLLIVLAGCKPVDALFGLCGSKAYTGGGFTPDEKQADFERQQGRYSNEPF